MSVLLTTTQVFSLRVEFEDVDAGQAVHHPNYLKYYERARARALEAAGVSYAQMIRQGLAFVVAEARLKYLKPAFYEDHLWVMTRALEVRRASFRIRQALLREAPSSELREAFSQASTPGDSFINDCELRLALVDLKSMKTRPLPAEIRCLFE